MYPGPVKSTPVIFGSGPASKVQLAAQPDAFRQSQGMGKLKTFLGSTFELLTSTSSWVHDCGLVQLSSGSMRGMQGANK